MTSPTGIGIERIDHLVLTVRDLDATLDFYGRVLRLEVVRFGSGRVALRFGSEKLNVHVAERDIAPHAAAPTPGCLFVRFLLGVANPGLARG